MDQPPPINHQSTHKKKPKSNFYVEQNYDEIGRDALTLVHSSRLPSLNGHSIVNLSTSLNATSTSSLPSVKSSVSISENNVEITHYETLDTVVQRAVQSREEEYIDYCKYKIFIGTWNVNGRSPEGLLHKWLAVDDEPPDIYALGLQELDLSKEAFVFSESPKEEEWLRCISESLHPQGEYVRLKLTRLIGMMLVVFVKKELEDHVANVTGESVGTGLFGRVGNKGGVSIRMEFRHSSLCFVNCHLAAHHEELERRNQDVSEINSRLMFLPLQSKISPHRPLCTIKDHDHIYWFGDMNYRITDITADQVKKMIEMNELDVLYQYDQLRIEREKKKVFSGYHEGVVTFIPTYKYDVGTDNWDSSEKQRPPAWCDRILYRGGPTQLVSYRSHNELRISDHKPVSALFDASIKVIDQARYKKVYHDVIKTIDKLENEYLPQVQLDKHEINFGIVYNNQQITRILTVANTGNSKVWFTFSAKPKQNNFCKTWLNINPSFGAIEPGDIAEIELIVHIDQQSASAFKSGHDKFDDILILHLEHGKDLFITVSGEYQESLI